MSSILVMVHNHSTFGSSLIDSFPLLAFGKIAKNKYPVNKKMDLEKIMEFDCLAKDEKLDGDIKGFEMKVDKVYKMLEELTCNDDTKVKEAEEKIDKFLAENKTEEAKR